MRPSYLRHFLALLDGPRLANVFNPWTELDAANDGTLNSPEARRQRLRAHLAVDARLVLIGEASGYQGCHVTGMAFTSERLVIAGSVPRVSARQRLSTRHIPWSEPSATTVWKTLHALDIAHDTVLWNAFPWHPHLPGNLQSNRTPSLAERAHGLNVLQALLRGLPAATLFAVGKHAELALRTLGHSAVTLRHPSMGGAALFAAGLREALKR